MSSNANRSRLIIVLACVVVQAFVIGTMFAYGVFFKSLQTEFGWTRTFLSAVTSVSFLVMGVLAIVAGRLSDRIGPRIVLTFSAIAFGVAICTMYFLQKPWQLFVLYGLIYGIALSTHDVVTLSVIARWFKRRRGRMTGVIKSGAALGQIAMPLICVWLITSYGWRLTCLVIGIVGMFFLLFAAQFMRRDPPPEVIAIQQGVDPASDLDMSKGSSFAEARNQRSFWTLCAIQFLFFPALVTVPLHLVPHGMDLGMSAAAAAALLSTIAASSIVGRLTIGTAIDQIGPRNGYFLCLVVVFFSLLILRVIEDPSWLYVFAVLYGVGHGGLFTVVSPAVAEYFGMVAHGSIFGAVVFFGTIGAACGPWLAGWIFDTYGSYDMAFIGLAALLAGAIALVLTLRKVTH